MRVIVISSRARLPACWPPQESSGPKASKPAYENLVAVLKEINAAADELLVQPKIGYLNAAIARVKEMSRCDCVSKRLMNLNDKLTYAVKGILRLPGSPPGRHLAFRSWPVAFLA